MDGCIESKSGLLEHVPVRQGTLLFTLLADSLRSFLDKSGKRLSRKIEGDSVRRVAFVVTGAMK